MRASRSQELVGLKKCFHLGVRNHFLIPQSHKIPDSIDQQILGGFMCRKGYFSVFQAQYQPVTKFKLVK